MCDIHSDKVIYLPGTLRKVSDALLYLCLLLVLAVQKAKVNKFSALVLNFPDTTVCIGNLDLHVYTACWDVCLDEEVCEFHGVIGQDKQLIHTGDFVELTIAPYDEVPITYFHAAVYVYPY